MSERFRSGKTRMAGRPAMLWNNGCADGISLDYACDIRAVYGGPDDAQERREQRAAMSTARAARRAEDRRIAASVQSMIERHNAAKYAGRTVYTVPAK